MEFKNLFIWQKATELAESIYSLKHKFPSLEKFGLGSQLRRASVSVPSNIAEGSARGHKRAHTVPLPGKRFTCRSNYSGRARQEVRLYRGFRDIKDRLFVRRTVEDDQLYDYFS